jgi:LmbE family N-acetylglucosaminyl deacetylase
VDRGVTRLWVGLFTMLGPMQKQRQLWQPKGGERVLVVAPHPDDEVLGCGGTLFRHIASGDAVVVLIVTDGRLSRAQNLQPEAMARARHQEALAAAELLGVEQMIWLGMPEGAWFDEQLQNALATQLREYTPDIIYAPCWLDYHPEHRRVADCLAKVVEADTWLRICTGHVPLAELANLFVDVTAELRGLKTLMRAYRTQEASLLRGLRLRRYAGARSFKVEAVEEFWELSGESYRVAHDGLSGIPAVRGFRFLSLTDPLSYLVGRAARRYIARRAGDQSRQTI